MTQRTADLLAEVLALPEAERADFAERLLESLDPPPADIDQLTDEEFAAELERRAEELRRDPSAGIPWERVRDMR